MGIHKSWDKDVELDIEDGVYDEISVSAPIKDEPESEQDLIQSCIHLISVGIEVTGLYVAHTGALSFSGNSVALYPRYVMLTNKLAAYDGGMSRLRKDIKRLYT